MLADPRVCFTGCDLVLLLRVCEPAGVTAPRPPPPLTDSRKTAARPGGPPRPGRPGPARGPSPAGRAWAWLRTTCSALLSPSGLSVSAGVDGGAVRVTGAKGVAPSCDYKVKEGSFQAVLWGAACPHLCVCVQVCATYTDGFRATAVCPVGGPRAVEKARRTAESIIKRCVWPRVSARPPPG